MRKWHLFRSAVFVLAAAVAMAVGASFLPDNPYERFQLLDGTIFGRARYYYERMHYDPRPIDVAVLGDSRAAIGLKGEEIERQLQADGKPAAVVNFALYGGGRNLQWVIFQELLKTKRPKVIVMEVDFRPHPWGHDAFHYVAPGSEIWREASHGLYDTKRNLVYLPFRQLRLAAAMVWPEPFGLTDRFDRAKYEATPRDEPERYVNAGGELLDFRRVRSRSDLLAESRNNEWLFHLRSHLPASVRELTDADDRVYTDLIAREAARAGVKILFVYQPAFHRPYRIENRDFYSKLGTVQDDLDLSDRDELYYDYSHFNSAGAKIASDRAADAIAKMLP